MSMLTDCSRDEVVCTSGSMWIVSMINSFQTMNSNNSSMKDSLCLILILRFISFFVITIQLLFPHFCQLYISMADNESRESLTDSVFDKGDYVFRMVYKY